VTLTIQTEQDDQRQMMMTVEVPEERVEKEMRQAARKLARDIHIPGFRRGKAPYGVILRRVGRETLRADVIENLVQPILEEAVKQAEVELYAPPSLDDMEVDPLVFKFTLPLTPEVELGDYRVIRKEIKPVEISEEAIEEALEQVRIKYQVVEEVDRPAESGDIITVSGKGELTPKEKEETTAGIEESEGSTEVEENVEEETAETENDELEETSEAENADTEETAVEDNILFNEESIDLVIESEKLFPRTPFVDNMIGLSAGDESTFSFVFPEDYEEEELAGREANFNITVLNVKKRDLPELDDDLAKQEGDYENVDQLREAVAERLHKQAVQQAKNEVVEEMIDDLLEEAKMTYPPAAVEQEIDSRLESFKSQITRSGWEWEDYLKLGITTEDKIREDFRESSTENLKRRLALRQFIFNEKLTIETGDVDAAIEDRVSSFGDNEQLKKSMGDYFRSGYGFEMISSEILMDKAYERIEAIYSGNAPDLDALEEESQEEYGRDEEE